MLVLKQVLVLSHATHTSLVCLWWLSDKLHLMPHCGWWPINRQTLAHLAEHFHWQVSAPGLIGPGATGIIRQIEIDTSPPSWPPFSRCSVALAPDDDSPLHLEQQVLPSPLSPLRATCGASHVQVGTLALAGLQEAMTQLRALIRAAGKHSYTVLAGKPNPTKLANFPEVWSGGVDVDLTREATRSRVSSESFNLHVQHRHSQFVPVYITLCTLVSQAAVRTSSRLGKAI